MNDDVEIDWAVRYWKASRFNHDSAFVLADAYLALTDETPATVDWLGGLGWERSNMTNNSAIYWFDTEDAKNSLFLQFFNGNLSLNCNGSSCTGHEISDNATRGQVRMLCRALGITMNEEEAK